MARHIPATNRAAATPHPVTLDAVLARWLDGEALDLTCELRKAAAQSRGETQDPAAQRTHWSFLADL
jgi:hypothetical protein